MAYTLKTNLSNRGNYGSSRSTSAIKYIVIHYTANDGDSDESNGNYFHNNAVKASAHYFVDKDSVTQSVPDNYVAWSVGGSKYSSAASTGGAKYYGIVTNANSISIELCDNTKDGTIYPAESAIQIALELTRDLMKKYNVPVERVIRHFDVTGKLCPAYWCGTATKNALWESAFHSKLNGTIVAPANPTTYDNTHIYTVKVNTDSLNVRDGAGTNYAINTTIKRNGVYTVVAIKDGWGLLKSGAGWISMDYVVVTGKSTKPEITTLDAALNTLVDNKVINTPTYWQNNAGAVEYLKDLIIKMANTPVRPADKQNYTDVKAALAAMATEGVINTPAYWEINYTKVEYLKDLIIKFANKLWL